MPNPLTTMRPATRTALIMVTIVIVFLGLFITWVYREAQRIATQRKSTKAAGGTGGDMVFIPAGKFTMGANDGAVDEQPIHDVKIRAFYMDKTEVTNAQWERFTQATGYITIAERTPDPKLFPGAPPEKLVPGSVAFRPPPGDVPLDNHWIWWDYVPGANWRHPEGPQSSIKGREYHPVVHVCWDDAVAYSAWAGKRLPTEAEWEYAARGGLPSSPYVWGNERLPSGRWPTNIWQGKFPNENLAEDGFPGSAPVGSYPPNSYGLFDMAGNVWEWCADWYSADYYAKSVRQNPLGPAESRDPAEPGVQKRVTRGGSWMCSDMYCRGYRPSARMKSTPDTGLQNTGFRCAKDS